MARLADERAYRAFLDDAPGIHDRDAICHLDRRPDVMGHEDHGETELALQFAQQQQDLNLDGCIERGGRLVGEQQLRPAGQRKRDHRPLAHAATQFVGIGIEPPLRAGNSHAFEQLQCALTSLVCTDRLVATNRLDNLCAHGIDRVECEKRLLEDHRSDLPAVIGERPWRKVKHQVTADADAAAEPRTTLRVQAQKGSQRDAFARARFADQRDHLAATHLQVHTADRVDRITCAAERYRQALDVNEDLFCVPVRVGGVGLGRVRSERSGLGACHAASRADGASGWPLSATCIQQATA